MTEEINTCSFCKVEKPVLRQYLNARNKPTTGDGFSITYYCNDCGLGERVIPMTSQTPEETQDTEVEEWEGEFGKLVAEDYEYKLRDRGVQEKLKSFIHHQLQKARDQTQERCKYVIEEQVKALKGKNLGHDYYIEGLKMAVELIHLDQQRMFEE